MIIIARLRQANYLICSLIHQAVMKCIYRGKPQLRRGSRIDHRSKIHIFADVEVGEGAALRSIPRGYHGSMPFPCTILVDKHGARVKIGSGCRLNGVYVHAQRSVRIGRNCVIASGANITDSNGHELLSTNRTIGRDKAIPIDIGDNVWIGMNAIVLKGAIIGSNCVIGANSVVSGEFPENSLIIGNPAKAVKRLTLPSGKNSVHDD